MTESSTGIQYYAPWLKEHQQQTWRQVDGSEAKAEAQSIPKAKKSAGNWVPHLEDV